MICIGPYQIETIVLDSFALDGGAMFGSVPKNLWSKRIVPDEQNRIPMVTRILKISDGENIILVDLGCGSKWSEKFRAIYKIENLLPPPSDASHIILTHLHFDHSGGISRINDSGEVELTFPDVPIYLNRFQFEHALDLDVKDKASFLAENTSPLQKANLQLVEGSKEVLPGISLHQVDGHTPGLQWVKIQSGSETVVFPSDLIPTYHHLDLPYIMGYDLNAQRTLEEKREFLLQASNNNWLIVFQHDSSNVSARVSIEKSGKVKTRELVSAETNR